jgi:hypothetical protein
MHGSWSQTEPETVPLPFVLQQIEFLLSRNKDRMLLKMRGWVEVGKQKHSRHARIRWSSQNAVRY